MIDEEGHSTLTDEGRQSHLSREAERYGWYQTIELAEGVITKGMFDHRAAIERYLMPADLTGMRCLDVGTMDGFWAFEMERRGAREVIASDVGGVDDLDWPPLWRARIDTTMEETKAARFRLAHSAIGSRVERVERSVYALGNDLGRFDLVFCGDLLLHLKDPITAIERIRSVCRGSAIICNPVERFRFGRRRALAQFDGINEFQWWLLSEVSIKRMMLAAGFRRVEVGPQFELPARGGGRWKGLRAVMRGFVE
ncbi:MAG: class I SAM-dependent methyltransferase [Solirubrobacteraceae bacterium]